MRVLYFHHATNMGGAPKSLALLISRLVGLGIEAIVVMPRRAGNEAVRELFHAAGARVIEERDIRPFHGSTVAPNRRLKEKLYALASYWPLLRCSRRLVAELKPDLVHLNSTCLVAAAHGAHLTHPALAVIAHVREPILRNAWGGILRRLNRRHVDHYISIDAAGDCSLDAPTTARDIVRNSAGEEFFRLEEADRQRSRRAIGWDDGRLTLLSLSRVSASNGACELATAMANIEGRLPRRVRVVLAGFGPEPATRYEQATMAAIDRSKSCEALPFLEDVIPAIAACDAVIAPFLTSHSARSVFEGAAAGRPALVSRLPNLTELIEEGQTGQSFVPGDNESLLNAITRICDDENRTSMGAAARNLAREKFGETQNANSVLEIYRTLIISDEKS